MALAETARLIASLELLDKFTPGAAKIAKSVDKLDASISSTGSRSFKAGQQIGTGIKNAAVLAAGAIGFLATNVGLGLRSLTELESITTQTNAVLKSTKGVAGESAQAIRDLAEKYEGLNATIDDKVIQSGENVLLTFTNIRKQAFEPALAAALDLSTALGQDLQTSIVQVGKALQDPVRGITALRRVGVSFTADQEKVIKKLVETGDVLGAQKVILGELNTEFGGSFLAQGNTTAGKVAKFKDAIEDLQKALATALLPTVGRVADVLSKFLADPQVIAQVEKLGESIAGLFSDKNLAAGADFLKGAFETAKEAAPVLEAAGKATFTIVKAAVDLFKTLPEPIQKLAVGAFAVNKLTGGLVTNIAGGIGDLLKDVFLKQRGATPANPLFVADITKGVPGVPGLPTGEGGGGIGGALKNVLKVSIVAIAAGVALDLFGELNKQTQERDQQITDIGKSIATEIAQANVEGLRQSQAALTTALNQLTNNGRNRPNASGPSPEEKAVRDYLSRVNAALEDLANGDRAAAEQRRIDLTTNKATVLDAAAIVVQAVHGSTAASEVIAARIRALDFKAELAALRKSSDPAAVAKAAAAILKTTVKEGRGDVGSTKDAAAALRASLKNVHDPALQASIRAALSKVEGKLPGREFASKQLSKADALLRDGKVTNADLKKIQSIEAALKDRGLPHAAAIISERVENAKRAQVAAIAAAKAAQVAASLGTTRAIQAKDLSVALTTAVTSIANVSLNGLNRTVTQSQKLFTSGAR